MVLEEPRNVMKSMGFAILDDRPGWGEIYGLGWACADQAHIPALPEALALLLDVPAVRLVITRAEAEVCAYAYRKAGEVDEIVELPTVEVALGAFRLHLTLGTVDGAELTPVQKDSLRKALDLMRMGLECILVMQADRITLGEPFNGLSDREWEVCKALEGPLGEKQIALDMACSRHTVHSYVKGVYRKMRLRSRLQVMDLMRKARERVRCRAVGRFTGRGLMK
jgi:DNA-binding CsgD family transcriptional regulator